MREITAAAGANLGSITYHFGSKRALHLAVLDALFDEMATRLEALDSSRAGTPGAVQELVATLFRFFRESPDAPALILHLLSTDRTPPDAVLRHMRRAVAVVARLVGAGRAQGRYRDIDPVLVAFSVFSQSVWFAVAGRTIAPALFRTADHDVIAGRIEAHIVDVVSRALAVEVTPT